MTDAEADQRIILARRVIATWEMMQGGPSGRPEDTLRIVGHEIQILEQLANDHPGKAAKIGVLLGRYRDLQRALRQSAN
jgi:hypothetical protein